MQSKGQRTRDYILEKTAPLFNKKGFDGTSLADLTHGTGLTKGALYGNFQNKEDLALAAFKYSVARVREMTRNKISKAITSKQQLYALLNFYADYVFNPPIAGGCPLMNTAIAADDNFPSMRRVVVEELTATIDFINRLLKNGIAAGEFKKDINTRALAYTFFCSIEGAVMFARAEQSDEPVKIIVKHCKKLLNEISI